MWRVKVSHEDATFRATLFDLKLLDPVRVIEDVEGPDPSFEN